MYLGLGVAVDPCSDRSEPTPAARPRVIAEHLHPHQKTDFPGSRSDSASCSMRIRNEPCPRPRLATRRPRSIPHSTSPEPASTSYRGARKRSNAARGRARRARRDRGSECLRRMPREMRLRNRQYASAISRMNPVSTRCSEPSQLRLSTRPRGRMRRARAPPSSPARPRSTRQPRLPQYPVFGLVRPAGGMRARLTSRTPSPRPRRARDMAEGDTIHRTARRLNAAIGGERVTDVSVPNPMSPLRLQTARLGRLRGKRLLSAEARGKHLLLHFERELALHCHLGMNGSWRIDEPGARRGRSAWVVLSTTHAEAAQFGGTRLALRGEGELRSDPRLASLGPDLLAPGFRPSTGAAALRVAPERQALGEALLDQRLVAGAGNVYKSEGCFAASLDPWRPVSEFTDADLERLFEALQDMMAAGVEGQAAPAAGLPARRPAMRPVRDTDSLAWPGRRQPDHLLVPAVSGLTAAHVGARAEPRRRATPRQSARAGPGAGSSISPLLERGAAPGHRRRRRGSCRLP